MSLFALLFPLARDAEPDRLRALAGQLRRDADRLESAARERERDIAERSARGERRARRQAALQELRDLARSVDRRVLERRVAAVAARHGLDAEALLGAWQADRRRRTRTERAARDAEIMRLLGLGYRDAEIAEAVGLAADTVNRISRRHRAEADAAGRNGLARLARAFAPADHTYRPALGRQGAGKIAAGARVSGKPTLAPNPAPDAAPSSAGEDNAP